MLPWIRSVKPLATLGKRRKPADVRPIIVEPTGGPNPTQLRKCLVQHRADRRLDAAPPRALPVSVLDIVIEERVAWALVVAASRSLGQPAVAQ